jgi:hypothetical protein
MKQWQCVLGQHQCGGVAGRLHRCSHRAGAAVIDSCADRQDKWNEAEREQRCHTAITILEQAYERHGDASATEQNPDTYEDCCQGVFKEK